MAKTQVFLGGSCNPTTWRKDVAMPAFDKAGVTYYNPQVDNWHSGLIALENTAKADAEYLLFVIDAQTLAGVSIQECTELIRSVDPRVQLAEGASTPRQQRLVLVIDDIKEGTDIEGQVATGPMLKGANRQRAYLRDLVERNPENALIQLFNTVQEAVSAIIQDVRKR